MEYFIALVISAAVFLAAFCFRSVIDDLENRLSQIKTECGGNDVVRRICIQPDQMKEEKKK